MKGKRDGDDEFGYTPAKDGKHSYTPLGEDENNINISAYGERDGDDEFSYAATSDYAYGDYGNFDTTDPESEALTGGYIDNDEAFAANSLIGGEDAASPEGIGSYGDYLVEEFSAESAAEKMHSGLKMPESLAKYIIAAIYIIFGAAIIIFYAHIEEVLAYVAGSAMLIMGLVSFITAVINKEYMRTSTNKTVTSLIIIGLAIMIICRPDWGRTLIITVWGIYGLFEGARAFNHALARISRGMRCSYYIIKGLVELSIAFLLLYDSDKYGETHIIIFGVSLILDGLTVMPIWKKILDR